MLKKKKGSSIIMVLAVAMLIVVLGTTMTTAILYATRMNKVSKENTDLSVSAENGIEYGVTKLRENTKINGTFYDLNASSYVSKVDVKVTDDPVIPEVVIIESTATSIDSKTVKVTEKYEKVNSIGTDIFRFGAAAGKDNIKLGSNGSADFQNTATNSAKPQETDVHGSLADSPNKEANKYSSLNFIPNFKEKDIVSIGKIDDLRRISTDFSISGIPSPGSMPIINGVCKLKNDTNYPEYTVYLVRAKELVIEQFTSDSMYKTILVCSGVVKIMPQNPLVGGTLESTYSTIYGSKIIIEDRGSIKSYSSPKASPPILPNSNHLDDVKLKKMGDDIKKFITNFSTDPSGGAGGGSSFSWEKQWGSYSKE